eukprot:356552-Chlamydomonas_euryale.AAC.8
MEGRAVGSGGVRLVAAPCPLSISYALPLQTFPIGSTPCILILTDEWGSGVGLHGPSCYPPVSSTSPRKPIEWDARVRIDLQLFGAGLLQKAPQRHNGIPCCLQYKRDDGRVRPHSAPRGSATLAAADAAGPHGVRPRRAAQLTGCGASRREALGVTREE